MPIRKIDLKKYAVIFIQSKWKSPESGDMYEIGNFKIEDNKLEISLINPFKNNKVKSKTSISWHNKIDYAAYIQVAIVDKKLIKPNMIAILKYK